MPTTVIIAIGGIGTQFTFPEDAGAGVETRLDKKLFVSNKDDWVEARLSNITAKLSMLYPATTDVLGYIGKEQVKLKMEYKPNREKK